MRFQLRLTLLSHTSLMCPTAFKINSCKGLIRNMKITFKRISLLNNYKISKWTLECCYPITSLP